MPLFMFVSGILFGLSHFGSFKEYVTKMWKKTKMLIVPYLMCGILVYMWRGAEIHVLVFVDSAAIITNCWY